MYDAWNTHVALFCQIKDGECVKNVEDIVQVPGSQSDPLFFQLHRYFSWELPANIRMPNTLDAPMVGVGDLRCDLGP